MAFVKKAGKLGSVLVPTEPVRLQPEVKKVESILDYCQATFATLHNRKECIIKFLTPAPGAIIAPQGCGPATS